MTTTRTTLILTLFAMSACRDKPTCLDCEEAAEADDNDDDDIPLSDLPCGGADLMTDNLNCGTCGHECGIWYRDTEYEAGTCKEGICGPGWSTCDPKDATDPYENCSEVCEAYAHTCVPNGCAGLTGMMFDFDILVRVGCNPPDGAPPVVTLSGGCDEPIPWMTPAENLLHVMCCCDFQ